MVGNPTEVILVRICADAAKPSTERFGYSNAVTGLWRIGREEGVRVFGRGLTANVVRSVLMSKVFLVFFFPFSFLAPRGNVVGLLTHNCRKDVSQIAP